MQIQWNKWQFSQKTQLKHFLKKNFFWEENFYSLNMENKSIICRNIAAVKIAS